MINKDVDLCIINNIYRWVYVNVVLCCAMCVSMCVCMFVCLCWVMYVHALALTTSQILTPSQTSQSKQRAPSQIVRLDWLL